MKKYTKVKLYTFGSISELTQGNNAGEQFIDVYSNQFGENGNVFCSQEASFSTADDLPGLCRYNTTTNFTGHKYFNNFEPNL